MNNEIFIGCDWGTSKLRLYLCAYSESGASVRLESRDGPGLSQMTKDFETTFFELAEDWIATHGPVPVIISGMAGSTLGWQEAPYLQCPVTAAQIADSRIAFEARGVPFFIVAGLSVNNPLGSYDVMRGEELQLLGWMRSTGAAEDETRLFALPGTHNKWVLLRNGRLETFLTALTGELFALLENHSVLVTAEPSKSFNEDIFKTGLATMERLGDAHLLHALFTTRSQQVLGTLAAADASSYLSGLLTGSDVIGALALFSKQYPDLNQVTLIGDPRLTRCYRLALEASGMKVAESDATEITIAGYGAVYKRLKREGLA